LKKFILSDLHIGHKEAQYNAMDQAIDYIRNEAKPGDEIWGLGDWWHMYEIGFEHCLQHPMTQRFRDLAGEIAQIDDILAISVNRVLIRKSISARLSLHRNNTYSLF